MIKVPAMFVIGDDEERAFPTWTRSNCLKYPIDQVFAYPNITNRMLVIVNPPVVICADYPRLDERLRGQRAVSSVGEELFHRSSIRGPLIRPNRRMELIR